MLKEPQISINNKNTIQNPIYPSIKRTMDVLFALISIVILSPLILLIVIAIKVGGHGKLIAITSKVGKDFKPFELKQFNIYKTTAPSRSTTKKSNKLKQFNNKKDTSAPLNHQPKRSAFPGNNQLQYDATVIQLSPQTKNKKSLSRLGKFLRWSKLERIPLLLNVLLGDISFVGNQPLTPDEAEQLTSDNWIERFDAPAGLMGLWSISQRKDVSLSTARVRWLDVKYAREFNFQMDFQIILKTFTRVLY